MSPQKKPRAVRGWYVGLSIDLDVQVSVQQIAKYFEPRDVALLQGGELALFKFVLRGIGFQMNLRKDGLASTLGQVRQEDTWRVPGFFRAKDLDVERV